MPFSQDAFKLTQAQNQFLHTLNQAELLPKKSALKFISALYC
jgi:hypothetical protein